MKLKIAVLIFGILLVASGILALGHAAPPVVFELILAGGIIVLGIIFERGRYKSEPSGNGEDWEVTAERFKDETTGKWMRVRYNRKTGDRDYIEEDSKIDK